MDYLLTDEQKMVKELAKKIADEKIKPDPDQAEKDVKAKSEPIQSEEEAPSKGYKYVIREVKNR